MDIILKKEAPLELIRLISEEYSKAPLIQRVIIDINIPELAEKKALGAFDPVNRTVYIDMMNCLSDGRWMEKGALFIPNVWMNLLFVVYHELEHARQILYNPQLIQEEGMPQELEDEANEFAIDCMFDWFQDGKMIPPLNEMGWIGESIIDTLNALVSRMPDMVREELDTYKAGATAIVEKVISAHDHFNDVDLLLSEIDTGNIGLKVNGQRYLTANEFLAV